MLPDQQYHGAHPFVLCVLALYEHDGDRGGYEGLVDLCGMQGYDRSYFRVVLDSYEEMEGSGCGGSSGEYAQARSVAMDAVWGLIMVTITGAGIPEAVAAGILVAVVGKILIHTVPYLVKSA